MTLCKFPVHLTEKDAFFCKPCFILTIQEIAYLVEFPAVNDFSSSPITDHYEVPWHIVSMSDWFKRNVIQDDVSSIRCRQDTASKGASSMRCRTFIDRRNSNSRHLTRLLPAQEEKELVARWMDYFSIKPSWFDITVDNYNG